MKKIIDLYYYTGTGNTLIILKEMVKVFKKNNLKVNIFGIEDVDPGSIRTDRTIGLAFPVAFQSTFDFIWDF